MDSVREEIIDYKLGRECFLWSFLWLGTYFISEAFLKPNHIDYFNNWHFFSLLFILSPILSTGLLSQIDNVRRAFLEDRKIAYVLALFVVFIALGLSINYYFPVAETKNNYFSEIKFLYPYLVFQTSFTKGVDVLFQQIMILNLILILKEKIKSEVKVIATFGVIFFLIHLPLVIAMSYTAFLFIIPSSIAGFIFSNFILKFRYGLVYSIATHFCFYLLIAIGLRYIF
ncbi:hypothetical protein [Halobacteriovorax sp.]|uniref:hypothetical protein n=1 Tax=Halobacteriovorax sp. TaxID=2020862 RepID=UPI00356659F0